MTTENIFEMVEEFNSQVLNIEKRNPGMMPDEEAQLSLVQMNEEISEFIEARVNEDLPECIDAMIDLIYFAAGVCYKHGVSYEALIECFQTVHAANMAKAAGKKAERDYDGDAVDAMKPEGWEAPDLQEIIERHEG